MYNFSVTDWISIIGCLFSVIGTVIGIVALFRDKK